MNETKNSNLFSCMDRYIHELTKKKNTNWIRKIRKYLKWLKSAMIWSQVCPTLCVAMNGHFRVNCNQFDWQFSNDFIFIYLPIVSIKWFILVECMQMFLSEGLHFYTRQCLSAFAKIITQHCNVICSVRCAFAMNQVSVA